jgi:hypothetical protein
MARTVAEHLVDTLAQAGVRQIYGVVGDSLNPVTDALRRSTLQWVDVRTDPNVLSMPPRAPVQQAKGFALAMTKMAFTGELHDVLDTVAANWRYL